MAQATDQATPHKAGAATADNNTKAEVAAAPPSSPRAPREIAVECQRDAISFCDREVAAFTLLKKAEANENDIEAAIQRLDDCVARNIESLSSMCIDSIISGLVTSQARDSTANLAGGNARVADNRLYPDDSSVEVELHYRRSHHQRAGGPGGPARIRYASATHGSHDGITPFFWLLILPFFCIGLAVTFNYMRVRVRKRKEMRRVETKGYAPLNGSGNYNCGGGYGQSSGGATDV